MTELPATTAAQPCAALLASCCNLQRRYLLELPAEQQAKWARQALYETVTAVRPNAVALVDGFGFTDYLLNSALGRSDGDVYRLAAKLHLACSMQTSCARVSRE